jgi:Ca2+-binding EF-hand superfamily protein
MKIIIPEVMLREINRYL